MKRILDFRFCALCVCRMVTLFALSFSLPDAVYSQDKEVFYYDEWWEDGNVKLEDGRSSIVSYWVSSESKRTVVACSLIRPEDKDSVVLKIGGNVTYHYASFAEDGTMIERLEEKTYVVDSIDLHAFAGVDNLKTVHVSAGVKIGRGAFYKCDNLEFASIGSTTIDKEAFYGCENLRSVEVKGAIKEISGGVFYGCSNLKSVKLPMSVKVIGSAAFGDCTSLVSFEIPSSVKEIGSSAFSGCISLKSVKIPSSVEKIGSSAFEECNSLESVKIPSCVKELGSYAFSDCSSLKSAEIKSSNIGYKAFSNCGGLKSIMISENVNYINAGAFSYCNDTLTIENKAQTPQNASGYGIFTCDYLNSTLIVPQKSLELYKNAVGWKKFFIINDLKKTAYKGYGYEKSKEEVDGVTVDGLSQILINTDGNNYDGKYIFSIDGKEVTDTKLCGNLAYSGNENGYIYTAPEEYAIGDDYSHKDHYTVEIQFGEGTKRGVTNIDVYRPGVILIHGLNSNRSCFEEVYKTLIDSDMYPSVYNMDYSKSNEADFDINADKLRKYCDVVSKDYLYFKRIVSSRYDLVGHSMGGILSRLVAQSSANDDNPVNRIITLNTPHGGSPGASIWFGVGKKSLQAIEYFFNQKPSVLLSIEEDVSAWGELKDGTVEIESMNNNIGNAGNIPVHAVCTELTDSSDDIVSAIHKTSSISDLCVSFGKLWWNVGRYGLLGEGVVDDIMGEPSDGIVPITSQKGGLADNNISVYDAPFKGILGSSSNAHHTKSHHWNPVVNRIVELLSLPKSDAAFSQSYFKPVTVTRDSEGLEEEIVFEDAPEGSCIAVDVEMEQADTAKIAHIKMDNSENVERKMVFAILDESSVLVANDSSKVDFKVPDSFAGELMFYAIGKIKDMNAIVVGVDSTTLTNDLELVYMSFEKDDTLHMTVSQTIEPLVRAYWSNGEDEYRNATLTTDDGADIIEIIDGKITALNVGKCKLAASMDGYALTDTINVVVHNDIISGIEKVTMTDGVQVYNRGNNLVIAFGESYAGKLNVEIYDINGQRVLSRYNYTERPSGDEYTVDISALAENRLYVVKVNMDGKKVVYKMIR